MEGLTLLLIISTTLIAIGIYKKDYAILFLSSTLYILAGLYSMEIGFLDLALNLSYSVGLVFAFIGVYIIFRSSVELFKDGKTEKSKR
jgi:drug/metabolite transporter (DMT)-like permease